MILGRFGSADFPGRKIGYNLMVDTALIYQVSIKRRPLGKSQSGSQIVFDSCF